MNEASQRGATTRFRNLTAEEIVRLGPPHSKEHAVARALGWLDYAERMKTDPVFLYIALELRQALEIFWFEFLLLSRGGKMAVREYQKLRGKSGQLYKVLKKLAPEYTKLCVFTDLCLELQDARIRVARWDIQRVVELHGRVSRYCHWDGIPQDTWDSLEWRSEMKRLLQESAAFLGDGFSKGGTGLMDISSAPDLVKNLWHRFRLDRDDLETTRLGLKLCHPILKDRRFLSESIQRRRFNVK